MAEAPRLWKKARLLVTAKNLSVMPGLLGTWRLKDLSRIHMCEESQQQGSKSSLTSLYAASIRPANKKNVRRYLNKSPLRGQQQGSKSSLTSLSRLYPTCKM